MSTDGHQRRPLSYEGWSAMPVELSHDRLDVGGWPVMQRWEEPLMQRMAEEVTWTAELDVLDVGFGMGISATAIIRRGCRSYTVIEAHPRVAKMARAWASEQSVPIEIIEGFWQDVVAKLDQRYDAILFDTFPLTAAEFGCNHFPFISVAPRLLRPGGRFTCYSDETEDFRPEHLKMLLEEFDEVRLVKVPVQPPSDCAYWHSPVMVIPVATTATAGR